MTLFWLILAIINGVDVYKRQASGTYSEEDLAALAAQVSAYQEQVDSQAAQLEASRNQIAAARSELESGDVYKRQQQIFMEKILLRMENIR